MNREKTALLDKCTFSNILLNNVDDNAIQELAKQNVIRAKIAANGEIYYSIDLSEGEYVYKCGYNNLINGFGKLQTSVENIGYGNLYCYTVDEYKERLKQIKSSIAKKGIYIDVSDPSISKIEINRTFRINGDMATYERVLELLMALLPGKTQLRTMSKWENRENGNINKNTYYATSKKTSKSKQYIERKWYNKTKELKEHYKIILDENYIRLEFTICGAKKIKKELGKNRLNELNDDIINDWFDKKVKEWIKDPVEQWQKEQHKKVLRIMKECKKADGYKWVNKCITRLLNEEIRTQNGHKPLILDIEEVIPLVNELYPNGDKRKKTKTAFRKIAKEDAGNITNRDDIKLQELLEKLLAKNTKFELLEVPQNSTLKNVS